MLVDTTFREGLQSYGIYLSTREKMLLLDLLGSSGLEEMEIGWAGEGDVQSLINYCRKKDFSPALSLWCRSRPEDIGRAAELGINRINIGVPVSSAHMLNRLGCREEDVLDSMRENISLAKAQGIEKVTVGLEDASRADVQMLHRAVKTAASAEVDRIRPSDTVGVLDPGSTYEMVCRISSVFAGEIGIHCHNDFGMATANTLLALDSCATHADVSLLGLGERCGIARLEEIAGYLALQKNISGFDLEKIRRSCLLLAELTGIRIPGSKPICGKDIFSSESGLHVHCLMDNPELFEPYSPERIGIPRSARRMGWGEKSGRKAVRLTVERISPQLSLDEDFLESARALISYRSRMLSRPLDIDEVIDLLQGLKKDKEGNC